MSEYMYVCTDYNIYMLIEQLHNYRQRRGHLRKVGNVEMWFRKEMGHSCCGRERALVIDKGENEWNV